MGGGGEKPIGEVAQPGTGPIVPANWFDAPVAGAVGAAAPGGLGRFYAYQLVAEVNLAGGIWILYLQDRGLSLAQIGLAEACFHLAPITLELPSGSLADVLGRKWSLAIGSVLVAASAALILVPGPLWVVLAAMYLSGASYAFRSGAQQAFLYDALAERATTDRFAGVFGRLLSASYLIVAASTWLGAALADRAFAWPYALTVGVGLAGAWLAAGLREPARERSAHRSMRRTIGEALRIVRGRPSLAALLVFGAGLWTLLALVGLYAQAVLAERGLATSAVGLVIGASLLCTAVGAWFGPRIAARGSFPAWTVGTTAAIVGGGLGLGGATLAVGVVAYLVAEFAAGIYEPLLAARVNREVTAAQRATVLSVEGFLFSITMVWAFPLAGWVAGHYGWLPAYAGAGAVVAALLGAWLAVTRGKGGRGGVGD